MTNDSKVAYETVGKLAGINVLFDPDYTPRQIPLRLHNVSLQEALDIIALASRTFWRPVTPNTIFVAQDTQAKRRELEQNVVKTFYLGNVSTPTDLQDIVNSIRTVLEVQRIQQIPSQSAIVIKGTPDQLALASKMIDDIDKSKPEVIVDVVVAQVRRDKLRNLGITPPQTFSAALQGTNTTSSSTGGTNTNTTSGLNFNDLQHLNSTNYAVTVDSLKAVALFSDADTKDHADPAHTLHGQRKSDAYHRRQDSNCHWFIRHAAWRGYRSRRSGCEHAVHLHRCRRENGNYAARPS